MRKILSYIAAFSFLAVVSCTNDDQDIQDKQEDQPILSSDAKALSKRINFANSGVLDMKNSSGKNVTAGNFPLVLVAEVAPPVYNGKTLRATHVAVEGNYAYVSYNTEGETYLGAIEVLDVTNPNAPQLVMQAILPNTDVSSVRYDNGKLYIAGAKDIYASGATSPAFVGSMTLSGGMLTNSLQQTFLKGNVGTDVTSSASKYYAVSGATGVFAQLSKTSQQVEMTIPLNDLRALGYNNNKIVVLSGTEGVKIYDANGLNLVTSFATSADVEGAKRTIDFIDGKLLISEGYNGVGVYNLSSGAKLQKLAVPTQIPNVNPADIVSNAVSVNSGRVFVANGGAGIYVYAPENNDLKLMGSLDLTGSSNFVMSKGEYIFVATGAGGLKIIKTVAPANGAVNCSGYAAYTGNEWLNVNSGQTLEYSGTKSLQGINVNHVLTWCGALTASQGVNINSNATFNMYGQMYQGMQSNPWNSLNINSGALLNQKGNLTTYGHMILNSNAKWKVEGNVTIFGNLTINQGSKIEFIGSNSTITIHGTVTKNGNSTITGTFTDVNNKL
ncbi:LVIVD repeat-containing protein [Chryseobacterium terrae]|uniref:LVIVD repeat-containing protein n=1 Tax=Chryseobacterium terrae TaxID=3163299 RepID=A0ABW8Y1K4_9FLAO